MKWLPMESAPRDGTLVRLMVNFTEHATEDNPGPSPTIGSNNFECDGEDRWLFAGWCWTHDHFTQGEGSPVGWLPMLDAEPAAALDGVSMEPSAVPAEPIGYVCEDAARTLAVHGETVLSRDRSGYYRVPVIVGGP